MSLVFTPSWSDPDRGPCRENVVRCIERMSAHGIAAHHFQIQGTEAWVLNGSKTFITNGLLAGAVLDKKEVIARAM